MNSESEYADNKDKLNDLSDLAVLGKFTNNTASTVNVDVWMTKNPSSHTTEAALKADASAIKLWGPFVVGPSGTKVVDWNESAHLFSTAGKAALPDEAKNSDGNFSIYAIGSAGAYDFSPSNSVLVLVLDVGI